MKLFDKEKVLEFFGYIFERQRIYYSKEVLKNSAPWTKDEILQKYFFCNNFRELDKGTKYIIKKVIKNEKLTVQDVILNVFAYRFFNTHGFFENFGEYFLAVDMVTKRKVTFKKYEKLLDKAAKKGKLFNNAYIVTCHSIDKTYRKRDKAIQFLHVLEKIAIDLIYNKLAGKLRLGESAEKVLELIINYKYIGEFIGYQIYLDFTYSGFITVFKDSDLKIVGPGAIQGLDRMYKKGKSIKHKYISDVQKLVDIQDKIFDEIGVIKEWDEIKLRKLNWADIEFCLCEWRKYRQRVEGGGRRKYYKGVENGINI